MALQEASLKYVPGTDFNVDGFRFCRKSCRHYFLTHFHTDHTVGLGKRWKKGKLYCSPETARLVVRRIGINSGHVVTLEPFETAMVDGVRVTPLPAGHCPGAVMFLFDIPEGYPRDGEGPKRREASGLDDAEATKPPCGSIVPRPASRVLHTGDFRWSKQLSATVLGPILAGGPLDLLMLDTTYCSPRWRFPPAEVAVRAAGWAAVEACGERPGTLVLVQAYTIGKEALVFGIAEALGARVAAEDEARLGLLRDLDLPPEWRAALCDKVGEPTAQVRIVGGVGGTRAAEAEALETRYLGDEYGGGEGVFDAREVCRGAHGGLPWEHVLLVRGSGWLTGAGVARAVGRAARVRAGRGDEEDATGKDARHDWARMSGEGGTFPRVGEVSPETKGTEESGEASRIPGRQGNSKTEMDLRKGRRRGARDCGEGSEPPDVAWPVTAVARTRPLGRRSSLLEVPYSEHSSWDELRACVQSLAPRRLISTVALPDQRDVRDAFADLLDLTSDRSRIDSYLVRGEKGCSKSGLAPPETPLAVAMEGKSATDVDVVIVDETKWALSVAEAHVVAQAIPEDSVPRCSAPSEQLLHSSQSPVVKAAPDIVGRRRLRSKPDEDEVLEGGVKRDGVARRPSLPLSIEHTAEVPKTLPGSFSGGALEISEQTADSIVDLAVIDVHAQRRALDAWAAFSGRARPRILGSQMKMQRFFGAGT